MSTVVSRRAVLAGAPAAVALMTVRVQAGTPPATLPAGRDGSPPSSAFPSTEPALAREMVGVSHNNIERVRAILETAPPLANAAWDAGFGDWETALGAASHTGRREIATLLMDHGARPDVFTMAMLGSLESVKSMIEARPGLQRTKGPHGLTLMQHARAGGEASAAVVSFLAELGDADVRYVDLPLSEEQRRTYAGTYMYGEARDRLEVIEQNRGQPLAIRRAGGSARALFHQGEHRFHPAGAPDVHVEFTVSAGSATEVAIGPWPQVRAARVGP